MPPKAPAPGAKKSVTKTTTTTTSNSSSGNSKYLQRPEVIRFMDDIVKKCMIDEPQDPGKHVYEYLKRKYEKEEGEGKNTSSNNNNKDDSSGTDSRSKKTGNDKTPTPPVDKKKDETFSRQQSTGGADDAWAGNCTLEHVQRRLDLLLSSGGSKVKFPETPKDQPTHPLLQPLESKMKLLCDRLNDLTDQSVASLADAPLPTSKQNSNEALARPTSSGGDSVTRSMEFQKKKKSDALKEKMAQALFNAAQLLNNNSSLEMTQVISSVVNSVRELLHADRCACFIANEKDRTLAGSIEGKEFSLKYGQGIAGHVARTGCSLLIPNAYEDKRFDPSVDLELGYTTRDILCLPISLDNDLIAVVQLVNKKAGSFTKDDELLFVSFAQFAGIKIRNALVFKEQTRLAMRNKAMSEVTETLANTELVESRLIPVIVKSAKDIVGADRCAFFSVDSDRSAIIAHLEGVDEQLELPLDSGIVGHVAKSRQILNVPKAYDDPRFNKEVDSVSGYHTQSILCIPIFCDKKLVAVSQLVNKTLSDGAVVPFSEEDEEVLQAFASVAGVCIRNCRLFENAQLRKKMMETVLEIAKGVGRCDITKPESIMSMVSTSVCEFTGAEMCGLFVLSNDYAVLRTSRGGGQADSMLKSHNGVLEETEHKIIEIPYNQENIIGDCCRTQKPSTHKDVAHDAVMGSFGDTKNCAELYLSPVVVHDEGVGVICIVNKCTGTPFTDSDKEMVNLFSHFVAVAIRNSKLILAAQEQVNDWQSLMQFERAPTDTDDSAAMESLRGDGGSPPPRTQSDYNFGDDRSAKSLFQVSQAVWAPVEAETVDRCMTIAPDVDAQKTLNTHEFNIHQYLDGILPADELIPLGLEMFDKLGLFSTFKKLRKESLCKFLIMVRSKYRRVPYHNFFHAFDVTQTIFQLIVKGKLQMMLTSTDLLGLMLAGLVHDIDHMGLNNAFHLKAETPMGILTSLTGTKSVLEVHHCQLAIELLGYTNLLGDFDSHDKSAIYKTIIDAVLATDMAAHKDICTAVEKELLPLTKEYFLRPSSASNKPLPAEGRRLMVILLLKMADISNVTKPFNISRQWGIQVMDEFHAQGAQEKKRGLEVTPMFAERQELAKSQLGFINFLASPFFNLGVKCFPSLSYLTNGISKNCQLWEKLLADRAQNEAEAVAQQQKAQAEEESESDEDA